MTALVRPEARMGNDIARQFSHLDQHAAAAAIAAHIERFWNPRMRAALHALVASGDECLDPLLIAAESLLPAA